MRAHLKYASYVARHKWYVFQECARVGLFWRGVIHDWHKLLPEEWQPYKEYFHGEKVPVRDIDMSTGQVFEKDKDGKWYLGRAPNPVLMHRCDAVREGRKGSVGYTKPNDSGDDAFDLAWLRHQKRADHHWQWWLIHQDDGDVRAIPMSDEARLEMVCDWVGASMAQGYGGIEAVGGWYEANKDRMTLHPETRLWVETYLAVVSEGNNGTPQ